MFSITVTSIKDQLPIRANIWFWFKPPRLELFLFCYVIVFFSLIGSDFIDPDTCPWVLLQILCGTYPNRTYICSRTIGLRKVVARITVGRA